MKGSADGADVCLPSLSAEEDMEREESKTERHVPSHKEFLSIINSATAFSPETR